MCGSLLKWFSNFLTKRSQRVEVDGKDSEWTDVLSGVPQGTVLGPLLFLTFINDIRFHHAVHVLVADDCFMYRPINTGEDCEALQKDLDSLHSWTTTWYMKFNADKCNVMHVSHHANNIGFEYHLGNQVLTSVDEHPYLGLTFTSKLSWKTHISNITLRANLMLGLIKRLEALPPPSERTSLHLLGQTTSRILLYCLESPSPKHHQSDWSHPEESSKICEEHLPMDRKCVSNALRPTMGITPIQKGSSHQNHAVQDLSQPYCHQQRSIPNPLTD